MTIGEKIRKARKAAKMSQKDISVRTGFAVNTISRYENGERIPNIEAIAKIAAALGMDIYDLAKGVEIPGVIISRETYEAEKISINDYVDTNLRRIMLSYDKLNNDGKEIAAQRVEELAEIERYTQTGENSGQN